MDSLSESERSTMDELLRIGTGDVDNLKAALALPWVHDGITKTEYDAIYWIRKLNDVYAKGVATIIPMPFLENLESDDVMVIRGLHFMSFYSHYWFDALIDQPELQNGITDDQATLVIATATILDIDEISRMLEPGYAVVETVSAGTKQTPHLKISIVHTGNLSTSLIVSVTKDAVEFVERTMGLPLPVSHVIYVMNIKAIPQGGEAANYGYALAFNPDIVETQDAYNLEYLRSRILHEIAHYYWGGPGVLFIMEGLADTFVYMHGIERGLSPLRLKNLRGGCEVHDLEMWRDWDHSKDSTQSYCNYYLGQSLFVDLLENMGEQEFKESLRDLYRLFLSAQDAGEIAAINEVRQAFLGQSDIVEKHWSGKLNAPENRPFDEGVYLTNHGLVQWDQYPTYNGGRVTFSGTLLADAVLSQTVREAIEGRGFANFTLYLADGIYFAGLIEHPSFAPSLRHPEDTKAIEYSLSGRTFSVEFPFRKTLGNPSNYIVVVRGFQDDSRTPIIDEAIDILGYARIRVE